MSGIAGIARGRERFDDVDVPLRMAAALRHRGPDAFGIFADEQVALTHVRLSAAPQAGGGQPLSNETGQVVVVAQGRIFNEASLRVELENYAHHFRTGNGAEVLVHAYEQWGMGMLQHLDGDFAFVVYDRARQTLFLARDRFGVCPLFHAVVGGDLVFGSEIKALLASGAVQASPDYVGLDEAFTIPGACAPRTPFAGVAQLEPGTYGIWRNGRFRAARYYDLKFIESDLEPLGAVTTLDSLLRDSVAQRARAGGRLGGRLTNGMDDAVTCLLGARHADVLPAFRFASESDSGNAADLATDRVVDGCDQRTVNVRPRDIVAGLLPTVWHAEAPLIDLAPTAMYLLARAVREQGVTVMLGSEGAAELFLGHDLFKETVVRLFCLRQPESRLRPLLFGRVYPEIRASGPAGDFWQRAILAVSRPSDPLFSHMPRFALASRIKDFYSPQMRLTLAGADPLAELRQRLPPAFASWSPLNRAAFLDVTTRLPSYLLSAGADRVTQAHGVEMRYPFLDHRVVEFAAMLPTASRLRGLREMEILRRWSAAMLPPDTVQRDRNGRAPGVESFFSDDAPSYVTESASPEAVRRVGVFDADAVRTLMRRGRSGRITSVAESHALIAILSTQLWFRLFQQSSQAQAPLALGDAEVVLGPGTRRATDAAMAVCS